MYHITCKLAQQQNNVWNVLLIIKTNKFGKFFSQSISLYLFIFLLRKMLKPNANKCWGNFANNFNGMFMKQNHFWISVQNNILSPPWGAQDPPLSEILYPPLCTTYIALYTRQTKLKIRFLSRFQMARIQPLFTFIKRFKKKLFLTRRNSFTTFSKRLGNLSTNRFHMVFNGFAYPD